MPVQTTYNIGSAIRSVNCDVTAINSAGLRLAVASTGLVSLAGIEKRGEFVSLGYIEASRPGEAGMMQAGGKVPAIGTGATSVGDTAYTAANGQFAGTSGANAVICGKWMQACPGAGQLGEVELENPL